MQICLIIKKVIVIYSQQIQEKSSGALCWVTPLDRGIPK